MSLFARFARDRSGNIAVTFSLTLLPLASVSQPARLTPRPAVSAPLDTFVAARQEVQNPIWDPSAPGELPVRDVD